MTDIALRRALRRDVDTITDIWVDAFSTDPWLRYMQPDDVAEVATPDAAVTLRPMERGAGG